MQFSHDDTITLLAAFLGSGAIAAVVSSITSAIVSLHTNSKNAKLEYITKERGQWRREIREIAVELERAKSPCNANGRNGKEIRAVLTKLKVRINANGLDADATDRQDKHIWTRIKSIESMCGRVTEDIEDWDRIEEELEGLIRDLSRLLKDDWERTKAEVSLWYRVKSRFKKGIKKS